MEKLPELLSFFTPLERAGLFVWAAVVFGGGLYVAEKLVRSLMGAYKMRRKAKLRKAVLELVEDAFVEGLSKAIELKQITIDDARVLYSRFAHLGLWGLHPRKFEQRKSPEQLAELKDRLKNGRSSKTSIMDGLEAELANL